MSKHEQGDDSQPAPAETGDALSLVKQFARDGYMQAGAGTEAGFEELWRTAFYVEEVAPGRGEA
jgi:hypothetical protein